MEKKTLFLAILGVLLFGIVILVFALALSVQSDPSELEFFVGCNLLLVGLLPPLMLLLFPRSSSGYVMVVAFLVFIVMNSAFLKYPHWRYPPEWTGGKCFVSNQRSSCLVQSYLYPVLGQCDIQRGTLTSTNTNTNFVVNFTASSILVDIPLALVNPELVLDSCFFYCGKAHFYPQVKYGQLIVSLTTNQTAPDHYLNFFVIFLPLFAIAVWLNVWAAQKRQVNQLPIR